VSAIPQYQPLSWWYFPLTERLLLTQSGHSPFAGKISLRTDSVGTSPSFYDTPAKQLTSDPRRQYYVNNRKLYVVIRIVGPR